MTRIVDDDQAVVGGLQRLFRRMGYAKSKGITDSPLVVDFFKRERVGLTAALISSEVRLDTKACDLTRRTAPPHDIGKISVANAVLRKPDRLTEDGHKVMQTHTIVGAQILGGSSHEIFEIAATIARSQHERLDRHGYPNGTAELEIPLNARIVVVADVFDMLTHDRPYKQAYPFEKALQIVVSDSRIAFRPIRRGYPESHLSPGGTGSDPETLGPHRPHEGYQPLTTTT